MTGVVGECRRGGGGGGRAAAGARATRTLGVGGDGGSRSRVFESVSREVCSTEERVCASHARELQEQEQRHDGSGLNGVSKVHFIRGAVLTWGWVEVGGGGVGVGVKR